MRTIKGWIDKETEELKSFKSAGFDLYDVFEIIFDEDIQSTLCRKYDNANTDQANQMICDIVDFWRGDAEFPKEKLYVLRIPVDTDFPYYAPTPLSTWGREEHEAKKLTIDEIKKMDERLVPFAVEINK